MLLTASAASSEVLHLGGSLLFSYTASLTGTLHSQVYTLFMSIYPQDSVQSTATPKLSLARPGGPV